MKKAKLILEKNVIELPIIEGSESEKAIIESGLYEVLSVHDVEMLEEEAAAPTL